MLKSLILSALLACANAPVQPQPGMDVAQGLSIYRAGSGGPAVVFEAGLGDGKANWRKIAERLAPTTAVVTYDRPGYGQSWPTGRSRSGRQIVNDLRAMLRTAGVAPPYVLVGHSLGGSYMELFARSYPGEVAGLVLVESRHAAFGARCLEVGASVCDPPSWLVPLMGRHAKAEFDAVPETMQQLMDAPPLPPIPLVVISGARKLLEGPRFKAAWLATQRELAASSPLGQHVICKTCAHHVQKERPELVLGAIRDVVTRVRRGASLQTQRKRA